MSDTAIKSETEMFEYIAILDRVWAGNAGAVEDWRMGGGSGVMGKGVANAYITLECDRKRKSNDMRVQV